jgi:hypothetical protein
MRCAYVYKKSMFYNAYNDIITGITSNVSNSLEITECA